MRHAIQVLALGAIACNVNADNRTSFTAPRAASHADRPLVIHSTVEAMGKVRKAHRSATGSTVAPSQLAYKGGIGGNGVEITPKIYLILWGAQWSRDPAGEASLLQGFYSNMGGTQWLSDVTQYCQGLPVGTTNCNGAGAAAGNGAGMLAGVWSDNASAAPTHPTQTQLAAEALNAANHFGNATVAANVNVHYVVATAHNNNTSGFGTQFCAWHSWTNSSTRIAYTNLPYMTDAGASCGANFNSLGPNAGITIVAGHEVAETITDPFPSTGWVDGGGAEIGDKCAWIGTGKIGAAQSLSMGGAVYPLQSLWSNASSSCTVTGR